MTATTHKMDIRLVAACGRPSSCVCDHGIGGRIEGIGAGLSDSGIDAIAMAWRDENADHS